MTLCEWNDLFNGCVISFKWMCTWNVGMEERSFWESLGTIFLGMSHLLDVFSTLSQFALRLRVSSTHTSYRIDVKTEGHNHVTFPSCLGRAHWHKWLRSEPCSKWWVGRPALSVKTYANSLKLCYVCVKNNLLCAKTTARNWKCKISYLSNAQMLQSLQPKAQLFLWSVLS